MTVTQYSQAEHGALVSAWWEEHTGRRFQPALLPPVGVVGIDRHGPACACWLHLSAGVGVAFLENPVSRPGMGFKKAKESFETLLAALEVIALSHDYGVLVCHTPPAIARTLKRNGFTFHPRPVLTGEKLLR